MLFLWNRGTGFSLKLWETQRWFRKKTVYLFSNEVNLLQLTIVFHLIRQLVCRIWFLMGCPIVFFPLMLFLDVSCQIHSDRHLHSLTNVDVGKDYDTCGRTSMFTHDLCPCGDYHTQIRTDKWTHIPGKVLQVWKHGLLVYVTFLLLALMSHTHGA